MTHNGFATNNVVATFSEREEALRAVERLHEAGVDSKNISFLSREDAAAVSEADSREEAEELPKDATKDVAIKGGAGAALGGAAGFLAGAIAFGIPGVGPGIGAGIWAATLGGAAAGGTAGGVAGGILSFWEERYRDAVKEGSVLVGVHTDNSSEGERATHLLRATRSQQVDLFDEKGERVASF